MDDRLPAKVPPRPHKVVCIPEDLGPAASPEADTLAARARGGDRAAIEALLRSEYPSVLAVCRRILGDPEDARDAAQNALVSIATRIGRFDGRSAVSTWCYRIATNAALDELRRQRRRPESVPIEYADRRSDGSGQPEGVVAGMTIESALRMLPPDQRAVLLLRHRLDLDYEEIARTLGVPVGTVRSRISRARAALAPILDADDRYNSKTIAPQRNPTQAPGVETRENLR